jgi:hypothetical protein
MKIRILVTHEIELEIESGAELCGRCIHLYPDSSGPGIPRCGLFTGTTLDADGNGWPIRADECKKAEARAIEVAK